MADEKKEASGIAAEAGGTSHEAEAKEAIEWWHPATMMLSSTCTNCKAAAAAAAWKRRQGCLLPLPSGVLLRPSGRIKLQCDRFGFRILWHFYAACKLDRRHLVLLCTYCKYIFSIDFRHNDDDDESAHTSRLLRVGMPTFPRGCVSL